MTSAWRGPRTRSAIRSAAYDTDSVEPLDNAIGRFTFHDEVTHASTSSPAKSSGRWKLTGKDAAIAIAPTAITAPTYTRTARGCSAHVKPFRSGVTDSRSPAGSS